MPMADEPETPTLRMLRQIDAKLDTMLERINDLTARVASLEDQFSIMKSDLALMRADIARIDLTGWIKWTSVWSASSDASTSSKSRAGHMIERHAEGL
jgi:hypothetical protein